MFSFRLSDALRLLFKIDVNFQSLFIVTVSPGFIMIAKGSQNKALRAVLNLYKEIGQNLWQ